ncbi:YbaB/EbfC family nucleoid-associated protein [Nocardioides luteus]|uniref:YbaB/EbfC family nucleoid-associated protein n=1 Tax=Nocardioides luteus TaxID=1844 RepID=UPI0018CB1672|nr:YbaB/EbfC family nucleoid-associated protein [Nocardioides luteus]MBG6098954.1 DNA-binding protein YbaB [Nocardioides luteus]
MTNPLEGLGGEGGFDLNAIMQQAQALQSQIVDAQEKLAETIVDGTVAGGAVTVKLTGTGELVGVEIKQGEFDGSSPDDLEDLGAVIVAAYREAKGKADALAGEAMGPLAGGLGGGMGAPGGNEPPFKLGF